MKVLLLVLLAVLAQPLRAETIAVETGEHPDFTRIVVPMQVVARWQMGRTADGYALRIDRPDLRFDLTGAFRVIPRTRLAAIWADPETGDLRLGIGCACYAFAFEFRPDTLVIDLRNGPPPIGSAFEMALDGGAAPALAPRPVKRPRSRPGGLVPQVPVSGEPAAEQAEGAAPSLLPSLLPPADLEPARAALLMELGRAASAGLVELDDPSLADAGPQPGAVSGSDLMQHFHAGEPTDASILMPDTHALGAEGEACLPDEGLALAEWAGDGDFASGIAGRRAALIGEFDKPDPGAVAGLVQFYLAYGFGAEARAVLAAFPAEEADQALWLAMARILDGEAVRGSPFDGQGACPGAAALWASLALDRVPPGAGIDRAAVALAFSALPLNLRRQLGPALAEKFLASGDVATAQTLREAIRRAPGAPGPAAELLDAKLEQNRGEIDQGADRIAEVAQAGGPLALTALIDLVDARIAQGQAVDGGTIAALTALANENEGGPLAPALRRAEMLARGSAGDFDTAFALGGDAEAGALLDLWRLLAARGPDSAVLGFAILEDTEPVPELGDNLRRDMATRLADLGFPAEALRWLPDDAAPETVILAGRAELLQGDARATLRGLSGAEGEQAELLRAGALRQLGDLPASARAFEAAGRPEDRDRALWRARDWLSGASALPEAARPLIAALLTPSETATGDGGGGSALAASVAPAPDGSGPGPSPTAGSIPGAVPNPEAPVGAPAPASVAATPLADGRAMVEASANTRGAVLALLAALPAPAP